MKYIELTPESLRTVELAVNELRKPEHKQVRDSILFYIAHKKRIREIPHDVMDTAIKNTIRVLRITGIGGFHGSVEQADKGFDVICQTLWNDLNEQEHYDILKTIP